MVGASCCCGCLCVCACLCACCVCFCVCFCVFVLFLSCVCCCCGCTCGHVSPTPLKGFAHTHMHTHTQTHMFGLCLKYLGYSQQSFIVLELNHCMLSSEYNQNIEAPTISSTANCHRDEFAVLLLFKGASTSSESFDCIYNVRKDCLQKELVPAKFGAGGQTSVSDLPLCSSQSLPIRGGLPCGPLEQSRHPILAFDSKLGCLPADKPKCSLGSWEF